MNLEWKLSQKMISLTSLNSKLKAFLEKGMLFIFS
jgi:hypothetical protein